MPRIDLQVPFAEKDAAKHLGARWDSQNTTWYVPDGHRCDAAAEMDSGSLSPNIRAEH